MSDQNAFYTADELAPRLSISTLVFWQYRPVERTSLGYLAESGIRRIELLESREQFDMTDPLSMKHVGDACDASGVEIAAYHAHQTSFSDLDTEEKRIARVDLCRRQIDTMLELGGKLWGSHAHAADATVARCYEDLARHVEGTGATIAIENFVAEGMWVEDRMVFLDEMDHPQVGMILDIGHVRSPDGSNPMTVPGGPTRVLDRCGHPLRHLHLHGFRNGVDHFPPLADGDEILWLELFRALHRVGYPGDLNFEPAGEPQHHWAVEATAKAFERIVAMAEAEPA